MVVTREQIDILFSFSKHLHRKIINVTGGTHGVRDEGGLFHSLSKILALIERLGTPFDICAFSYREFSTRHHFNDGNKRFSHTFSKALFLKSGYLLEIQYKESLPVISKIAAGQLTINQIREWIKVHSIPASPELLMEYLITLEEDLTK